MNKKIVITGPESTGKTTLTNLLAEKFNAQKIEEFARNYLENLDRNYEFEDVLLMANEQLKAENNYDNQLIFCDTDLTVYSVWIKEKYQQEIDWIEDHLSKSQNKTYLLCDVDVEWVEDPLREHPSLDDRKRIFNAYQKLLEKYKLTFHVISGEGLNRVKKAEEIINSLI